MSDLVVFENDAFGSVRMATVDGEPWFVAKDVAEALGYEWNGSARIAHVPEEWRGVTSVVTPSGVQNMLILSEQGLYFFLGRSDKPKALPYQKWIAGEVVPTIRKTGGYGKQETVSDHVAKATAAMEATRRVLEVAGLERNQVAIGMSNTYRSLTGDDPLALSSMDLPSPVQKQALTPTEIGMELGGVGPREINRLLVDMGYQTKRVNGGYDPTPTGEPHALLLDTAKRHCDGTPVKQLKWYTSILDVLRHVVNVPIGE